MSERTFDEVAADLDDLVLDVDELHNSTEEVDHDKLAKVKAALEQAKDAVDDIAEDL